MNFTNKFKLLLFLWVFAGTAALGQITNDSTQLLYGPKTTRVLYEDKFLSGNYEPSLIDTTLHAFYSNLFWIPGDTTMQQNLGNWGTATKPIIFQYSRKIGARLGRLVYDYYAYESDKIAYIDTRSPYTLLHYIQGTRGENMLEAQFSRNLKKWWTAGLNYRRVSSDKQLGTTINREGQVESNAVAFFTHLQTTNNRYHLFANFTHLNHALVETGGVRLFEGEQQKDLFDFTSETVNLNQATARDIRHSYHIGQQYALASEDLKIFYNFDHKRQYNRFDDAQLIYLNKDSTDVFFHPDQINYNSSATYDKSQYNENEHTGGITGNRQHYFYRAYLKYRSAKFSVPKLETRNLNQLFVGGNIELKVNEKIKTLLSAEYKPKDEYFARAELNFLFLGLVHERTLFAPDLMQQRYFGNHHSWNNNFNNTNASRTAVWLEGNWWNNAVKLELATTTLRNYVFYNESQQPQQFTPLQRLNTVTLNHHFSLGKFNWQNWLVYSDNNQASLIRVPDFAANSRIYYQGFIFKKAMFGQVGVEFNFRSAYFGDDYSPALQQFYLQNTFRLADYPVIDPFIAADIKSLNVFLKFAHVNERLTGPGYFTTPFCPGMRRSFIFGVKWFFFD